MDRTDGSFYYLIRRIEIRRYKIGRGYASKRLTTIIAMGFKPTATT